MRQKKSRLARLYEKIHVDDNGCWLFTGSITSDGYGRMSDSSAHRAAYEELVGSIPNGMELDHICHDPSICTLGSNCQHRRCVNPDHLRLSIHADNARRSVSTIHHAINVKRNQTHCKRGHEFTEENTWRNKRGHRWCRICQREYARQWRAKFDAASAAKLQNLNELGSIN